MTELYHHGIKGQRWGVRRYQNKDGTLTPEGVKRYQKLLNKQANKLLDRTVLTEAKTLPKGTKMYRITVNDQKERDGPTYVTYLDIDRKMYKAGAIRERQGSDKAYEREFTLQGDLKIPSRKEAQEVVQKIVMKDKKLLSEAMEKFVEMRMHHSPQYSNYVDTMWGGKKKTIDTMIDLMSQKPIEQSFYYIAQSLGLATNTKNAIISEMEKRGYNAMVDEAGVGGNLFSRQGMDPLIVFDSRILGTPSIKEVSRKEEAKADRDGGKWYRKVNLNKSGAWSAINNQKGGGLLDV